ncbi:origin recognition complex subunit 4 [Volvox carteri f. nagariensis]|uniref:Origin recognition complex subunit 4 n=1 Tax=Volvox carteri f. nagariensis TaxID=3068 RepID=D8TJG3_VOLCA|nr:origin recognition complex subunit 4 [Volvox carteri f. nagariensis]EFJ52368.1 origin recognition complex subunit 4 [Volvox carteri f. nagariensis]|eukprot:XP_002946441.1 origin recognition complex subunit 4 [Volvox carteri f. nagariensis]
MSCSASSAKGCVCTSLRRSRELPQWQRFSASPRAAGHRQDAAGTGTSTVATEAAAATATDPTGGPVAVHNVGVVRLNGLLQPDERTAFQEVARQLCRDFGQKFVKSATFDENLVFLKGMLHALYKCLKKVVFVVDEFQQYAKKGKQQMLYYLLDMLQDSKIQAAVIGISSAHNVAEDLEKRVLSRVGRRRVLVTFPAATPDEPLGGSAAGGSPGGSAAKSPGSGVAAGSSGGTDSYDGLLYDMLALHPGMAGLAGLSEAAAAVHNAAVAEALRDVRVAECLKKLALIGAPPQHLALVAEAALAAWGDDLRRQGTASTAGPPAAGSELLLRRRQGGSVQPPVLGASHLVPALGPVTDAPERALVDVVSGLPVLSLVLLVAAHRLQRKGQPMCNFEMVWDEYRSIQGQRGAIAFSKQAAAAAWQALPLSGLGHYTDANVESRGRDLSYAGVMLLVGAPDLDRGIRQHPHCPDAVTRFHMQEI